MTRRPVAFLLFLALASLFIFGCSLSLNVNGGDTATPTSAQDSVEVAVAKTLTALAKRNATGADGATPDATRAAENVNTLVAQALLTQQPTAPPPSETRIPPRPTRTSPPPTIEIAAPPPPTNPPTPTSTPTSTPTDTETPPPTLTFTPTPTQTFTPTRVPTHCPQQYCIIMQSCQPGENTRAVGTVYEHDAPKNGVRIRVSYALGGPPVIPDFISGNDPYNPHSPDPQHPGYYQLGLLEGGALAGNWWVFVIDDGENVISEGRLFNTQGQTTATSCQVGITDFYR